jgi:5-methylcytosine-specific restriction enzyme subunit McrC
MVKVAQLALDLVLPSETSGDARLSRLDRDEQLLRRIFEKAVAGLYKHVLHGRDGWRVDRVPLRGVTGVIPALSGVSQGRSCSGHGREHDDGIVAHRGHGFKDM